MKKALLSVLVLLLAGMMPVRSQLRQSGGVEQNKLTASSFTATPALSLSKLPGAQRYGAGQDSWWQRTTPATRSELIGNYIHDSYNNVQLPTSVTGMYMMGITAGASADQVVINNIYGAGGTLQGTLNAADGTITIASGQVAGTMEGQEMRLYLADFSQNHYYRDPIVARISPRGIVFMPQMLAVLADGRQMRCYGDILYKLNATQTDYSLWLSGDQKTQTYPVHYSRTNSAQVLIKNFYGLGYPVTGNLTATDPEKGDITLPYTQVGVGQNASGSNIVVRNYNVTAINYNTTPPTPTCNSSATPATFRADSIVTGSYCVAGSTTANRMDLVLKSVIKVQPSDAYSPLETSLTLPGSGTLEDPYRVATPADLVSLSLASNYNGDLLANKVVLKGKYFVQTADIDMSGIENFEPICVQNANAWGGHYDGRGHAITNLTVSQTRGSAFRAALFGEIAADASVSNIRLVNAKIVSVNGYVGSIAGYNYGLITNVSAENVSVVMDNINSSYCGGITGYVANNARVEDCSVSGSVKGQSFVGGIAGNNNGAKIRRCTVTASIEHTLGNDATPSIGGIQGTFTRDTAMIEDCLFAGTLIIIGNEKAGGILGESTGKGQINRCWSAGQIMHRTSSSSTALIGGIVAKGTKVQINDCLMTGIVQSYASASVGGIAADLATGATVNGTLMTGTVMCAGDVRGNEIYATASADSKVENTFFDNQACYNSGTDHGMSTAVLTSGQLPAGFSADAWDLAAGKYPILKRFAAHDRAALDRAPIMLANGENIKGIRSTFTLGEAQGVQWCLFHNSQYTTEGNGLKINGNNVEVTATTLTSDTIVALSGNYFRMIPVKVTPKEFDGDGTEASPYIIRNKADLDRVFKAVDVNLFDYSGTYFRLEGDIDFAGVTGFVGYSRTAPAYGFNGILDGKGHHIKNLVMTSPGNASQLGGLIVYTGPQSVIRNLVIDESCSLIGGSNVAPVVASYGRLENIVNRASVTALDSYAAGIASLVYGGSQIVNCYNEGVIRIGHRYGGGIAAQTARGSLIQGCQNSGNVIGAQGKFNTDPEDVIYIGGIAGDSEGAVHHCLNQGMIAGFAHTGGIIGSFSANDDNKALGCLNTGVVVEGEVNGTRGALFGSIYSPSAERIAGNCYDNQFAAMADAANGNLDGVTALTTAQLTSGNPVEGLDKDLWQYAAGKYPVLKAFASQPAAQWYASTRVDFATAPRVESRFDKRHDATIVMPQGSRASLVAATKFTIADGTTLRHTESSEVATDTLKLTSADGRYSIDVPLFATPRLLADGDGSEQNPWIINNANDWNTLALYSNEYQKGFDGEYFRLGADLDFASGFEAICLGNAAYFNGILDGNGKTIRNLRTDYDADNQKYVGMIGSAGPRAKVFNLTIDSTCNFIGNQYVGSVAGHFEGEIYNVTNRAVVSTSKMQYAGGIAGETDDKAYIHHCVNYGVISSLTNSGAGGILGQQAGNNTRVEDCVNYGPVSAKGSCGGIVGSSKGSIARCDNYAAINSSNTNAGGILGYFWCVAQSTVTDCRNYAEVKATGNAAGGIVGYMQGTGHLRGCVNNADVTSGASYAGGILGTANTASASWTITDVENKGNVTANTYAGGVIGYSNNSTVTAPSTLDSAVNYGNVKAIKTTYAGGIAGNVGSYVLLRNVYNYGDTVSALTYGAGGIAGKSTGSVINAYNHADVTAGSYNAGGIVGESNTSTVTDYGCTISGALNVGHVKSLGTTDATSFKIGGILGTGWVKVENSVNMGDVTGRKSVAGIVGLPLKGKNATTFGTQVLNCYSTGRVVCTVAANAKTCGAIMGDNTTAVTYTNIANSYYDTQMSGTSIGEGYADVAKEGVTGLATAALFKASLGNGFTLREDGYAMPAAIAAKDFAAVAAAAVVLADADNADRVLAPFRVTRPEGVVWSGKDMSVSASGNMHWTSADLNNPTPLTAALGNCSRRVMLQLATATGVDAIDGGNAGVREVMYYNLNGMRLSAPQPGVNVRVTIYNDGSRRTDRIMIGNNR